MPDNKINTLLFIFFVLFAVLIGGCKEDPFSEYGNELIDIYQGTKVEVEYQNLKNIQRAVQLYRSANGKYPESLKDIEYMMDSPIDITLYQYNPKTGTVKLIKK